MRLSHRSAVPNGAATQPVPAVTSAVPPAGTFRHCATGSVTKCHWGKVAPSSFRKVDFPTAARRRGGQHRVSRCVVPPPRLLPWGNAGFLGAPLPPKSDSKNN